MSRQALTPQEQEGEDQATLLEILSGHHKGDPDPGGRGPDTQILSVLWAATRGYERWNRDGEARWAAQAFKAIEGIPAEGQPEAADRVVDKILKGMGEDIKLDLYAQLVAEQLRGGDRDQIIRMCEYRNADAFFDDCCFWADVTSDAVRRLNWPNAGEAELARAYAGRVDLETMAADKKEKVLQKMRGYAARADQAALALRDVIARYQAAKGQAGEMKEGG